MKTIQLTIILCIMTAFATTGLQSQIMVKNLEDLESSDNRSATNSYNKVLIMELSDSRYFAENDDGEIELTKKEETVSEHLFDFEATQRETESNSNTPIYLTISKDGEKIGVLDGEVRVGDSDSYTTFEVLDNNTSNYRLKVKNQSSYLSVVSGSILGTTPNKSEALEIAFVSNQNIAYVEDSYRYDAVSLPQKLKTHVPRFEDAIYHGRLRCPSGSFFDPIDGGSCWECPDGYKRTVFPVNGGSACEKAARTVYKAATDHGKGRGVFGTECGSGQFWDPNGRCYSCPSGYSRTASAVTSGKACVRTIPASSSRADKIENLRCAPGTFFDLYKEGSCWECPDGYRRTIYPVYDGAACEKK